MPELHHQVLKLHGFKDCCDASGPDLVTHLKQTSIFEWWVIECDFNNGHHIDMCLEEIGLCVKNLLITQGSIANNVWSLFDEPWNLHSGSDKIFISLWKVWGEWLHRWLTFVDQHNITQQSKGPPTSLDWLCSMECKTVKLYKML